MDQMAVHFVLEGNLVHKDSHEAQRQVAKQGVTEGGLLKRTNKMEKQHTNKIKLQTVKSIISDMIVEDVAAEEENPETPVREKIEWKYF